MKMGVSLELWRARIGTFMPKEKTRHGHVDVIRIWHATVSLALRLCTFMLLLCAGVEPNPGPITRQTSINTYAVVTAATEQDLYKLCWMK